MNDYAKNRLLRVQENQARLKDVGFKSIAYSLTSLVESQKSKKKQVKPLYTGARDLDYIPDFGDNNDGDYHEVARSVEVSKKQNHPQYIAPMSMNRIANLTRQRWVIVPNVSNKYPLVSNKRYSRAKEIRKSPKNMHTASPKSVARICDEMKNEYTNKEFPTLTQMFEHIRKRTDEHVCLDTDDDTANKIEQMKKCEHLENESDVVDPYMIVMKKDNDGCCRLYGRGVTNRLIKKVGGDASYMISVRLMESFKANELGINELIEMRKEIQENHEKYRLN
uniref:Uncharacterized protein n=1 Tax=Lactuca sativa TaxID=4236 RepID=A0A9R1XSU3_LACSA|nr:hypothetical protein LSAT_V11C300149130 [Lactuca sativa]